MRIVGDLLAKTDGRKSGACVSSAAEPRVIVALDFDGTRRALDFVSSLEPEQCRVKVGKELFTAAGPMLVEKLVERGFGVFLDLKFHDIPNTVAAACRAAARLGVWMLNVHAAGGRAMLNAAREALPDGPQRPRLVAVTLLTSLNPADLAEIGFSGSTEAVVSRLASLAHACGLDGVVCSPVEVALVRRLCGPAFQLVTPGVRPADSDPNDQQRVATPAAAVAAGANYLVIGRPITRAQDPAAILRKINDDIASTIKA